MDQTSTPTDLATAYFAAWRSHDLAALRAILTEDVVFTGPMGEVTGREENLAALDGLLDVVTGVEIQRMVADGPDVVTVYDLHTTVAPPIPTVNWSRAEHGRLARIRAYFDPRPMLAGS